MDFKVQWHDSLPSTNSRLKTMLAETPDLPHGTVVAARSQTAGRGRHDRVWASAPGQDLACSILIRPGDVPPEWLPSLLMASALAVVDALTRFGVAGRLKWPNDVLSQGKKICGMLSEWAPGEGGSGSAVIMGIGVNVNMPLEMLAAIDRPATSIVIETGGTASVEAVLEALLAALPSRLDAWQCRGFEGLRDAWHLHAYCLGLPVTVEEGGTKKTGVMVGLDALGALRMRHVDGQEERILLGDVLF